MRDSSFSGKPDFKKAYKSLFYFEDAYKEGNKENEYTSLSNAIASLFISDDGYVIDVGGYRDVNAAILETIIKNVQRHPILWKLFMVC